MKIAAFLFAAAASVVRAQDSEFVSACSGKTSGSDCVYSLPDGSEVYGTCFSPASPSACGPGYTASDKCIMCGESDPTQGNDGSNSPAKENASVAACDDKDEGDSCAFTSPDGNKMAGFCEDQGAGACGPDFDSSSGACYVCNSSPATPEGGDSSSQTGGDNSADECTGSSVGDACQVTHEGKTTDGVCKETSEDQDTSDGHLACEPITATDPPSEEEITDGPISDVLAVACSTKSEGDSCSYVDFNGNQQNGECVLDNEALQCDNEAVATESGSSDSALVQACSGSSENDSCEAEFPELTLDGTCQYNEAGNTLLCTVARQLRGRQ